MKPDGVLKERLIQEIDKLPEERLQEVLNFVKYLLSREQEAREKESRMDLDPAKDPILSFIDGVSHGTLAKDIDRELYGAVR